MYGAIIGDLAGSIYEYSQIKKVSRIECESIIPQDGFFSDDTILSIAIADAIIHNCEYEKYLRMYGKRFIDYKPDFKPYFRTSFSPGFIKWIGSDGEGRSIGNGAMMRISPVGEAFNSRRSVLTNVMKATKPSHNSKEALYCSGIIALIIFYAKKGLSKEAIIKKLDLTIKEPHIERFNSTCSETIDLCLYSLFNSNSFEESIISAISYGGDTDTNACIVGSMAEHLYGIDGELKEKAKRKLPSEFVQVINDFEKYIDNDMERL